MFETFMTSLKLWNKNNSDRTKMQHTYFVAIIGLVIVAGLAGLLNVDLGRTLLGIASFVGIVFVVNAVTWALLHTFVIVRLSHVVRNIKK